MIKSEKDSKVKQEGQKPTTETQGEQHSLMTFTSVMLMSLPILGPPPPPTNQYYLPYIGHGGSPFFADPSHSLYRNMLVPPFNTPYHLQISRFPSPEDLSRNTKALDLLQQHASQYYSTHKIHELGDQVNHLRNPAGGGPKPDIPSPQIVGNNLSSSSSNNNGNSSVNSDKNSLKGSEIGKNLGGDDKDERKLNESGSEKDDSSKKDKEEQLLKGDDHHHHRDDDVNNENDKGGKESNDRKDDDMEKSSNDKAEKLSISSNDKDSSNSSFPSNHLSQLEGLGKMPMDRHDLDRISSSPPSQR
jgi:hypothetical protein